MNEQNLLWPDENAAGIPATMMPEWHQPNDWRSWEVPMTSPVAIVWE